MYRDAEKQLRSSLKTDEVIDAYLYLAKVYCRLDQPLTAIEVYQQALKQFPGEITLLIGIARIHEVWDFKKFCDISNWNVNVVVSDFVFI